MQAAAIPYSYLAFAALVAALLITCSPGHASDPQTHARMSLIAEMRERDRLCDPAEKLMVLPLIGGAASPTLPRAQAGKSSPRADRERLGFGTFDSPFGTFSLISRDLDGQGRIRDVNILAFDDPNSNWDMDLQVSDGAMFHLKRRWGAKGAAGPFASER